MKRRVLVVLLAVVIGLFLASTRVAADDSILDPKVFIGKWMWTASSGGKTLDLVKGTKVTFNEKLYFNFSGNINEYNDFIRGVDDQDINGTVYSDKGVTKISDAYIEKYKLSGPGGNACLISFFFEDPEVPGNYFSATINGGYFPGTGRKPKDRIDGVLTVIYGPPYSSLFEQILVPIERSVTWGTLTRY